MDAVDPMEDDPSKAVMLFGRDIRKIPCFKQSMLYGIYGGIAAGLATFMFTSRGKLATTVALGCQWSVTLTYWCACRYNYVMQKYELNDVKNILQGSSIASVEDSNVLQEQQKKLVDV
ncbi:cytochrome c oxidase assembly protein COX20, mitochondrial [Pogonomyrmex barbatus]|uniref:Cytochrome c oxidase assembly protein COX20, mitochondrial n=1 Tax=Pogonomyrmex barbatus TaxID=144034 RepID=A0A6I9X2Q7_9HYME|nr:cytochrome c oxidase assembly protein COX20, mitochondrial [Pogonomyrmex barbatus]